MVRKKLVLGKGMASLLESNVSDVELDNFKQSMAGQIGRTLSTPSPSPGVDTVAIASLRVNPYQPRKVFSEQALRGLADSIRENGLIQPIVVSPWRRQ